MDVEPIGRVASLRTEPLDGTPVLDLEPYMAELAPAARSTNRRGPPS